MKASGRRNLKKLREFMDEKGVDLILFKGPEPNVRYFSNFFGSCFLVIDKEKRVLITESLELDRAKKQADVEEIIDLKNFGSIPECLRKNFDFKVIGLVKSSISLRIFEELKKTRAKFFDVEKSVAELRAIKFKEEIELLKKSCKIANQGIKIVKELLGRKNIRESELALDLEKFIKEKGESAFETLVASGKRACFPHPYPFSSKNIIKGLGYVDFGASYKGYCSDVTLPFAKGNISEKERIAIKVLEEAYELSLSCIKEGEEVNKVYECVDKFLNSKGFELKHGLGHGLGLAVHDYPSISKKEKSVMKFKRNMVFTIEPAIYTKSFGIRIENDFLLSKKLEKLTNSEIFFC